MRTLQPSLTIEDSNEFPIAVVEVTSLPDIQLDEAIEIRSSMLECGLPVYIPYFLLLSPDIGFLWKGGPSSSMDSPPDLQFPMNSVTTRYLKGKPGDWSYPEALEWMALEWLMDLRAKPQEMEEEPDKMLAHAGFTDALHHSMILLTKDTL